jgi:lysophospholipase L1-like esterase
MQKAKRWKQRLVLVLLLVAIFGGATELLLRVKYRKVRTATPHGWHEFDERLGWRHTPGKEIQVEPGKNDVAEVPRAFFVRINAQGLREDRDLAPEPSSGITRIACIGDSCTFGYCVAGEAAFPKRLEAALGKGYETWNWGVSGYGIDQMLLQLERDVLPTKPRLVVLSVIDDDFRRATRTAYHTGEKKPFYTLDGDALVLRGVPVERVEVGDAYYKVDAQGSLVLWRIGEGVKALTKALAKDPDAADDTWLVGRALIREAARVTKAAGVKLVVVLLPTDHLIGQDPRARLLPSLEAEGIAVLDLYPAYKARMAKDSTRLFIDQFHPTEAGHELIADELAAFLAKRDMLSRP